MNPYQALTARSFWRPAVAEPDAEAIGELWTPKFALGQDDPVLTAGSCFAAELGRALIDNGMNFHDAEPAPPGLTREQRRARHYGEFSFRTGNIYTAAVLRQWLSWAFGGQAPTEVWEDDGRFYDPYRPSVEPDGYASPEEMLAARETTLAAIRRAVSGASCLIFTLGLTESWRNTADGTVYPVCPGTLRDHERDKAGFIPGESARDKARFIPFDPSVHKFHNCTFAEVHREMSEAIALVREVNPGIRVLLTVSPIPLTATATGGHALVANTYSKSVLRAVAGQLTAEHEHVDYFPSYELITGQPFRGAFYDDNLRTVTREGVAFVLRHFMSAFARTARPTTAPMGGDLCDDAVLDYYSPR
ncbi:GSCFA family protein [Amycolatopsis xylanica]|uniref:GSCFA family protein n=1 Tax=Amycolatopsis xylanica TaxID=589385 RepID=A0A1H3RP93_9PSEU|nr:GSCFA domain-containing protein [Amycolatopsis xylanica]SDZ27497.1 GSCFA family protein [Amycolatopsis xylanica]